MMNPRELLSGIVALVVATSAAAQQRPIFDPDDFIDPRERDGALFISRIVVGAALNPADDYRPVQQEIGFVHITNSFYKSNYQFDYKHSHVFGDTPRTSVCGCSPPIYFPTPPSGDSTPAAPPPGPKETLQFAWYHKSDSGSERIPSMLRYRFTWSWQPIDRAIHSAATGRVVSRRAGHEQSFGLEADSHFRFGSRDIYGSLLYAHTNRSGTIDPRMQNELAYMSRFPAWSLGPVLMRATLTVGGISGRGATGLNVVNPALEAFYHHHKTRANVHLVWSPVSLRSGAEGWKTTHQVAFFVDRALYVKLFAPSR